MELAVQILEKRLYKILQPKTIQPVPSATTLGEVQSEKKIELLNNLHLVHYLNVSSSFLPGIQMLIK